MALSVRLQQISRQAAGLYFIERTSPPLSAAAELDGYRLLIGQSKKGVTNKIIRIDTYPQFVQLFGDIDRRLERRGGFFHRSAEIMLAQGPIKVMNVRSYDDTLDVVQAIGLNIQMDDNGNSVLSDRPYTNYFNTDRNWFVDEENIIPSNDTDLLHIVNIGNKDLTVFVRPLKNVIYKQTIGEYYELLDQALPESIEPTMLLNDTFVEVFVFNIDLTFGIPSSVAYLFNSAGNLRNDVIDANGRDIDALQRLSNEEDARFLNSYEGSLISTLTNQSSATLAIDNLINIDSDLTGLICKINEDVLDNAADFEPPTLAELSSVATASALSNGKRPIPMEFYGTKTIDWTGSNMDYTPSDKYSAMSIDADFVTTNYNSLSNDSNTLSQAYVLESGKITAQEDVNNFTIIGNHIVHNNPMLLGLETPVVADFDYSKPSSNVISISGQDYDPRRSCIMTNATAVKTGTLFLGMDGNPTTVTRFNFIGKKVVFGGLHTSTFPLDSVGAPLATFNTISGNWEYLGGVSLGLPVEYNYTGIDPTDPTFGYPKDQVGGTVIAFPDIDDAAIAALVLANPTFSVELNYFVAEFDRPLYGGDDDVSVPTSVGARSNFSVLTLDNSLEIILYREPSTNANYMLQLNRVVDTTKQFNPISMKGLAVRNDQFVNGTPTRLEDVLNGTISGQLLDLLTDREYETYSYLVDSFESYPTANIKSQFTVVARDRQGGITSLINTPFVKTFKNSTDPFFKDSPTDTKINIEHFEDGGNLLLPYSQLFTLPTKQQGAAYGATYFPNATIKDNGRDIKMPMAPIVSNLFAAKWLAGQGHIPIFGSDFRVAASGLGKVGMELTNDDRAILERLGVNPIMQDFTVMGNRTLNQDGTALKSLHVRETLNVLQLEVTPIAKGALGKLNTEQLRATVKARVDSVLERYLANGALTFGRSIVDSTNNDGDVLAAQMLVIDIEVIVSSVAEKVVIRTTTFNSTSEIGTVIIV